VCSLLHQVIHAMSHIHVREDVQMVMIMIGIGIVFPYVSTVLVALTSPITAHGREVLERMFPKRKVDIDGIAFGTYLLFIHTRMMKIV
jgi:galactitol-specific phosphotransferase system IIC component